MEVECEEEGGGGGGGGGLKFKVQGSDEAYFSRV